MKKSLGQIAHEAFNETWNREFKMANAPSPRWEKLFDGMRVCWEEVAAAVLDAAAERDGEERRAQKADASMFYYLTCKQDHRFVKDIGLLNCPLCSDSVERTITMSGTRFANLQVNAPVRDVEGRLIGLRTVGADWGIGEPSTAAVTYERQANGTNKVVVAWVAGGGGGAGGASNTPGAAVDPAPCAVTTPPLRLGNAFLVGDKVTLKSGGPVMEIRSISHAIGVANCYWAQGMKHCITSFNLTSLVHAVSTAAPVDPPTLPSKAFPVVNTPVDPDELQPQVCSVKGCGEISHFARTDSEGRCYYCATGAPR